MGLWCLGGGSSSGWGVIMVGVQKGAFQLQSSTLSTLISIKVHNYINYVNYSFKSKAKLVVHKS